MFRYLILLSPIVFIACTQNNTAPVENRSSNAGRVKQQVVVPITRSVDGNHYIVQQGDNLYRIGLEHGVNYKDIVAWNNLESADNILVGQIIRVSPPDNFIENPIITSTTVNENIKVEPLPTRDNSIAANKGDEKIETKPQVKGNNNSNFIWPASGKIIAEFNEITNKGISISGNIGDPVLASSDGKVVYSGTGLRGYGNLVIVQHNNTYLTAYAHNSKILVKEDQIVKKGQKIAEIGNSDSPQPKLHFELRKLGKPVDPREHLPTR